METHEEVPQNSCCTHDHSAHHSDHDHGTRHSHEHPNNPYAPAIISFILLAIGLALDYGLQPAFFQSEIRLLWYLVAYLPVGLPVLRQGLQLAIKGDFFTEFFLMGIATIGAFSIGEYPEGVAVMLFYAIGELFQHSAVERATRNIQALLDIRPDKATVKRNGEWVQIKPSQAVIGDVLLIKPGEKVALDGVLTTETASFNTAALTGESEPSTFEKGETLLAGMISLNQVAEIRITKRFEDSALARILKLVQSATKNKANPELFVRKFARIYTPTVTFSALGLAFLPYFFVSDYNFADWLYRACVFLVISCPCALVISIPLGYFGGIGAASRHGILFKGSNYLDLMTRVNTVVMDKTGTLTRGVFTVQSFATQLDHTDFFRYAAALESQSTHPVAKAVTDYVTPLLSMTTSLEITQVKEIAGHGITARLDGKVAIAGNLKLLSRFNVPYPNELKTIEQTLVVLAIDGRYVGYFTIADELKEGAREALIQLEKVGVTTTIMLSGDKKSVVEKVAKELSIDEAYGNLLPEEKVEHIKTLKKDANRVIAFVGDGINDAPALALSDVGIAMGSLGSDAAIETADVILQTDQPTRIATAIQIGNATRQIVIQNITMAFVVKAAVLLLGAGGIATLWEAVFADVGVALLAILNAIRIQKMNF
jgi:Cd2+/Zn2+-exporting ATPase